MNALFEPQFIRDHNARPPRAERKETHRLEASGSSETSRESGGRYELNWIAKPTKEGFLYFQIPGTNTYQWSFPKVYDRRTKSHKYLFVSRWVKRQETTAHGLRKFWQHKDIPSYQQEVKPHSETYLIQAAIEGNLAFLEVYTKFQGDLTVQDQQGRSALIHSILNGRQAFAKMLLEFSRLFQDNAKSSANLLEQPDGHGATPLFTAIKVNSAECLNLLISYNVNLFHRKRNGNTCLHECALHDSVECLIVLASYCADELLSIANKDGDRALDVALKRKHSEAAQALQRLERRMQYQNAILDRDAAAARSRSKQRSRKRSLYSIREERSPASNDSSTRMGQQRRRSSKLPRLHLPRSSSSESSIGSSVEARRHLGERTYGESRDYYAERKHVEHLMKEKKQRRKARREAQVPTFKNYRAEGKQREPRWGAQTTREADRWEDPRDQFEGQLHRSRSRRHESRSARQASRSQTKRAAENSSEYFSQLRRQREHVAKHFGEESYLKPADIGTRAEREEEPYRVQREEASRLRHRTDKSLTQRSRN